MSAATLRSAPAFAELTDLAQRVGRDPLQIQGPGGNVSLKDGADMLVKASGTWLADAGAQDIFAHVDCQRMKAAVLAGQADADDASQFQRGPGLRPSIETGFHAALEARVVVHTHCVETLARSTAPIPRADLDARRLVHLPYAKPGAGLARAILSAWVPGTRGAVLANHGLIATGETVAEAEAVLRDAAKAFRGPPAPRAVARPDLDARLAGGDWAPLGPGATTALAFDADRLTLAAGPAFFPDQVIFIGPQPFLAEGKLPASDSTACHLALIPGMGAAVPRGASLALIAVAEMMGEVVFRLPPKPTRLSDAETAELMGWDAEKHRKALEKARMERLVGREP